MSLEKIIAADYGQPIELTFIDVDTGEAADISGYVTTIQMVFTESDGTVTEPFHVPLDAEPRTS